jgi:16S rRNA (uracil1498-N3)-methyltransferase
MRVSRVFVSSPLASGERATIGGDAANHIARVLRLRAGDPLMLFDGRGGEYEARLEAIQGAKVIAQIGEHRPVERESALRITLLQGIARGDRMDTIVQKATELGVARIVPVITERSVVKLAPHTAHRKHAHWLAIAVAACEQSGRNRVPELAQPQPITEATGRESAAGERRITLQPAAIPTLTEVAAGRAAVTLLIGPEGGLSPVEAEVAARAGFVGCRIGPRILRTETASLAAIAALQALGGDFT